MTRSLEFIPVIQLFSLYNSVKKSLDSVNYEKRYKPLKFERIRNELEIDEKCNLKYLTKYYNKNIAIDTTYTTIFSLHFGKEIIEI
uniref:Uncharacterized protein n=1 Tax=Rhodnius prolixus TaxID=13249 RepID=T1ICC3_RHOPR